MDARLSAEQRQLEDAADRLARNLGPAGVGDLDDEERRDRLEAALVQAGWRELRTGKASEPVASGVEVAIVARALARRACDTAFTGPLLALDLLRRAGVEAETPATTVAVAPDLSGLAALDGSVVTESLLGIDVVGSTSAVVLTATHELAQVSLGTAERGVDLTRPVAVVAAGSPAVLVEGGSVLSPDDVLAWSALAVTLTAADLVGTMEGALVLATDYAKQRQQYGAPIGSYQAVQHLLAEAATLTEGALSATVHAAWAVDALPPAEGRAAAAVAKAYAARAARTVCETAIQVHGGIGNTWECMAHVFLRRALVSAELFGGDATQLAWLARERWGATHGLS
jgi:alkylation response protein AidB-like acyl-CoA dehydrogenase